MNQKPYIFRPRVRGFTLIEAAMVTVIIGVGVVAMLQLLAAGSMSNAASAELTTGLGLANNVREWTQKMSFFDGSPKIQDFGNTRTFQPPRDGSGDPLAGFNDWSQTVRVMTVSPYDDEMVELLPGLHPWSEAIKLTVEVRRSNRKICEISWIVVEPVN